MQQIIIVTTDEDLDNLFQKKMEVFFKQLIVDHQPKQSNNLEELLSVAQASKLLGICTNTFTRLRLENKIRTIRVGRQVKVPRKSLVAFMKNG